VEKLVRQNEYIFQGWSVICKADHKTKIIVVLPTGEAQTNAGG